MNIERMIVEGGFLDGLDLSFSPGMNVLIGGRGTGKTSLIELMRFCLGVKNYTNESAARSREHALAILGDGQVTLTITIGNNTFSISKTASQADAFVPGLRPPIIFSQTDIESLGLEAGGRLRLIDSFRTRRLTGDIEDEKLVASVRSLSTEMREIAKEIEAIESQLTAKAELESQLKDAAEKERKIAAQSKDTRNQQANLQQINQHLTSLAVSSEALVRAITSLRNFGRKVEELIAVPITIERWPKQAGEVDQLAPVRTTLEGAVDNIRNSVQQIKSAIDQSVSISAAIAKERLPLEAQARNLRKKIDQLKEGAGEISRKANQIREKLEQLQALVSLSDQNKERLSDAQGKRGRLLDQLEATWERRFKDRLGVAGRINLQLNPRIRVSLVRAAQLTEYVSAISAALRGSGLRYSELSSVIAAKMSPRELVEIVEAGESEALASLLDISTDRAAKLIGHLTDHGTADILTAHVEDDAQLELLDGVEYKDIESLSTGQRCTVVLPIILEHKDRVLILDQPEDHLDNAFVVETLVKAILGRGKGAQLILSTHNANIPVLGDAAKVIVMGSDGRRGFIDLQGSLDEAAVVEKITNLMEGGAEAFRKRALFYRDHLPMNG